MTTLNVHLSLQMNVLIDIVMTSQTNFGMISNSIKSVISTWAIECNMNYSSISKLLLEIRENIPALSLPSDPRTLL